MRHHIIVAWRRTTGYCSCLTYLENLATRGGLLGVIQGRGRGNPGEGGKGGLLGHTFIPIFQRPLSRFNMTIQML